VRTVDLSRRQLVLLLGAAAGGPLFGGCASSPVSGQSILVGMSEDDEIRADRRAAPHQFSRDLGAVQDAGVNRYVTEVGQSLASRSHRPNLPYNYRALNANYVNAYTFPAGSIGVTRGILLDLDDEAELAALLGHEIGHVNARHAAQRQGQAMAAQIAVASAAIAGEMRYGGGTGLLVGMAGQVGSSALLASYSRDNEREADSLGVEYMTRAGYPADGMAGLMRTLTSEGRSRPGLVETMFSSHPMSEERLRNAEQAAAARRGTSPGADPKRLRERYLDATAPVRALRPTIEGCQRGELAAGKRNLPEAEGHLKTALAAAPRDYAANVLMAKVLLSARRAGEAQRFLDTAKAVYPSEAQALRLSGANQVAAGRYAQGLADLDRTEQLLPGDPGIAFLKGLAYEQLGDRPAAATQYRRYVQAVPSGEQAQYATQRLRQWGAPR
jgi:predicted Zn-dependent protease